MRYEKLTREQRLNYVALELRANMVEQLRARFPDIQTHQGDCQSRLDFPDGSFDRILAVHVLERFCPIDHPRWLKCIACATRNTAFFRW